jgi:predicted nucleic-acid-binding Zn-ribbon protein
MHNELQYEGYMMDECSKCGGKMIQGEAYVDVQTSSANNIMSGMMSPMSGMNLGNVGINHEERIKWREKTGEKKGFLIKSDEIRTIAVKGRRCLECGYIELYAQ